MQSRGLGENIQTKAKEETNQGQCQPWHLEWKPKNEKKIQVWGYEPMQGWDPIEEKDLNQQEHHEPDDIFEEITHCPS
jgi:hypothetical protein